MPKQIKRKVDLVTSVVALSIAIGILALNAAGFIFKPSKPSEAAVVTATTEDPTNITPTSADLNGSTNSGTNPAVTARGFQWGTDTNYGNTIYDTNSSYVMAFNKKFTEYGAFGEPGKCEFVCNVTTDSLGNIYTASSTGGEGSVFVQKFDSTGQYLSSFIKSRPGPDPGNIGSVLGIAVDSSYNIYLFGSEGVTQERIIKKYDNAGNYLTSIGSQGSGPGQFLERGPLAIDSANNLYAVDPQQDIVLKFNSAGVFQYSFGSTGSGPGQFETPWGIAVNSNGDIYASDATLNRLQIFNNSGTLLNTLGSIGDGPGQFNTMGGVALDNLGNTYITDIGNNRAQKFDSSLVWQGNIGSNFMGQPYFIAANGSQIIIGNQNRNTEIYDQGNSFTDGAFSASLTGLSCGQTYHYRTFAINADGTSYGGDKTFSFDCGSVTTESASNITNNSVTLSGEVVSSPSAITAKGFEYGTSPSYGSSVNDSNLGTGSYSLNATGLQCNTTYYFRAYMTNSYGTQYGNQGIFTTTQCSQMQVTTINLPGLNPAFDSGNAILFGNVINSTSPITQVGFEWGTSTSYGNTVPGSGSTSPVTFINKFGGFGSGFGQFNLPNGLATDSENNIYVSDYYNNRVQKFNSAGVFQLSFGSLGAGIGEFNGPAKLAVDSGDNLYVVDSINQRVQKFSKFGVYQSQFGEFGGGDGQFSGPSGIAIDTSGDILVTDTSNTRVQKFNSAGVYQAQFGTSGSGNGEFDNPLAVTTDGSNNIYVADTNNNRIQKFNSSGVYQAQFGTSGTNDGQFNGPSGVKFDSITGQIFVADNLNNRIQIFDTSGNYVNKFGEYGFNNGQFAGTSDVTTSANGNILATSINANSVQIFSNSSSINPGDFNAGLPGLTCGTTYHYRAYATNSEGSAYGSDVSFVACANISTLPPSSIKDNKASFNGTISAANDFITAQGFEWGTSTSYGNTINNTPNNNLLYQYNSQFGESGSGDGQFSNLVGLAKDSSNNTYVVDGGNNRIQKFNSAGVYLSQFGSFGSGDGQFIFPTAITIDSLGNIYVSDAGNNRVQKFNSAGVYVSQFGATGSGDGEFNQPFGLDIDKQGNIYVADSGNNRVQKFSSAGVYQAQFGTAGSGNGEFNNPVAVEVSILDIIYVSDQNNNRVNAYTLSGDYLGSISVNLPTGLTSNEQGIVMVASGGDNNIKLLDPQGNELIQFGSSGSGDGEFNFPSGIALDSSGNVYVGDYLSNRVQKFNLAPAFKFGSFNANIEGLSCDVTYHYRAFVTTSQGTFYGQDQTFTACLTMNTSPVSNATSNSGVLNGNVAATGNIVSRRGFEWGSSPSLGNTSFNTTGNNNANFIKAFGTLGADDGQFGYQSPFGTTFDSNGNLYATDYGNNRIQKFDENGNFISKFGSYGSGDGQFKSPTSVAIDKNNNIWVNDAGNSRIQLFDLNGDYVSQFPAGGTVRILSIKGDYAYVTGEGFVVKIDINTLTPVALIGTQGYGPGQWLFPVMATADNEGNVYVSDAGNFDTSSLLLNTSSKVLKYDSNGNFIKNIGGDAGQSSQIGIAYGINIDEYNNLYVADALFSRIQRFDTDGNYINQIGIEGSTLGLIGGFSPYYTSSSIDGQFLVPSFISSKNSSLYISDSFNSRIQKFELQQNFEPGSYNLTLEGLECGKQYYYRAIGTNQSGQNYFGNIESFKTTDCSPNPPPTPTPTPTPSPISPSGPVEPSAPTNAEVAVQSAGETAKSSNTPSRRSAPAIVVFAQEVDARLLAIARAVPREIAIAIPYAVISALLGFAILYIIQSIRELRSINRYNSLIKKYENIQLGAKNFVALTNHYLNTPIGIITLSAEAFLASSIINKVQFSKIKAVGEDIKASINKLLKENNKATDEIIKSIESKKTTQKPIKVIMSPLLWLPIAISAGLVAFANLLFVRAGVFGISTINLTVQIVLFVLFVVFTALALKSFLRNRQVKKDRKEVLDEEKKLISLKEKFIDDTSETLEKDLDSLKMISAEFASKKEAVSYLRGIEMLTGVGTSFGLLKKFAVASPVSTVTSYDIKRISKKIVKHQNSAIKSKGLKVKLNIDKNIRVRLDKPGLVVLMGSLMNNAIKFSSPKQDIIVIAKKVGTNVVIEIKDRGEIIEKDKLETLMTPFARTTDALKYDYEGLGLGLYMDRIIAEQAGGSIEITSSNQKGTVAKIKLPFANNS